jgi:hypothetical protein
MTYLNFGHLLRTETDPEVIGNLTRKGWTIAPQPPGPEATWGNGEWVMPPEDPAASTRKIWPHAAAFLEEFTLPELAAISLSEDPMVAALRLLLAAWPGEVWSDDLRIGNGLAHLIDSGILSEARRAAILAK